MEPTFADFTADPPRLANAQVKYRGCTFSDSHLVLEAGGDVRFRFTVDADEEIAEATLKVTALTAKMGPSPGHAPMTILVNGEPVTSQLTIPGGGDLPQTLVFAVPGRWLRPGQNRVRVRSSVDSRTALWLYRVTIDSVYERDHSQRAMNARAAEHSVFAFTTTCRPHAPAERGQSWEAAGRLLVHIDRGEQALPAQVSWRGTDYSEAAVSFQAAMGSFHGYRRDSNDELAEYRGRLEQRWAYPDGVKDAGLHRFRTEEHWGERWHTSGDTLRLLVDDEGAPVERITWRDQRGNSGSVAFEPGAEGFLGYYQRANEGPIGYRGTAIRDATPAINKR